MAIDGVPNLRPALPATGRQMASRAAAGGDAEKAGFKEALAARLERVRAHAANMRTYTGRAKVQLGDPPDAGNPRVDTRI